MGFRMGAIARPSRGVASSCGLHRYRRSRRHPAGATRGTAPCSGPISPATRARPVRLVKNFNIKERKDVQLRLEAYSASNSPQWGLPNASFGGATFGQITSAGGNRTLQLAVKFYY